MTKMKLPIFEWIHYIGWGITTLIIILVFNFLLKVNLYAPWYKVLALYLTLIIIDTINHIIKLQ